MAATALFRLDYRIPYANTGNKPSSLTTTRITLPEMSTTIAIHTSSMHLPLNPT